VAVDPSGDDLGIDSSQIQDFKGRSHNDHDDEHPASCPHPDSSRQEQAQDEEEQNASEVEDKAAVDLFRLPLLIIAWLP
jgi:hypothetical protein